MKVLGVGVWKIGIVNWWGSDFIELVVSHVL